MSLYTLTVYILNKLLMKNEKWAWGQEQDKAFKKSKDIISSDNLIIHFDPTKNLTLTCDAFPDGIVAVLSHGELPIAFASRSLNQAERIYSQLDRESLSIIFGVRKFHKFVYGREITIITDHKPLLGLFGENKPLPEHASPRLQRWAITLSAYSYQLKYKPGCENTADALSRLPLKQQNSENVPEEIEILFNVIDNSHV